MKFAIRYKIVLTLLLFSCVASVQGQDWRKLIPMISTCDDAKSALKLPDCDYPVTRFETPQYEVIIRFSKATPNTKIKVPRVETVSILFQTLVRLSDYETELRDYQIKPVTDAPEVLLYRNETKGVELSVQDGIGHEKYISSIFVFPAKSSKQKRANTHASVPE